MTIDCILFYGGVDLDLLKLRLKEHSKFVDLFVISELIHDFHGIPRETHENEIHELAQDYPIQSGALCCADMGYDPFQIANEWRNHFKLCMNSPGCVRVEDTDTIIVTDLDEILNPKTWNYTHDMGLMAVETRLYYYYLNLSAGSMWTNGFVAPYGFIKDKDISELRYNYTRRKYPTGLMCDAGWHFAWLGGKDIIKDKYRNFGAAEGWNPALQSDDYIDHILQDRILFTDGSELEIVSVDNSYPDTIRKNLINFAKFMYEFKK